MTEKNIQYPSQCAACRKEMLKIRRAGSIAYICENTKCVLYKNFNKIQNWKKSK